MKNYKMYFETKKNGQEISWVTTIQAKNKADAKAQLTETVKSKTGCHAFHPRTDLIYISGWQVVQDGKLYDKVFHEYTDDHGFLHTDYDDYKLVERVIHEF